jgi:uncharacterized protein YecE (DUF72 family)
MNWRLGTMGFAYDQWRNGVFYPAGMAQRQYLSYYSERFNAVEMDSTFYATPAQKTVKRWQAVTPPEFRICPKVPRRITHELRLRNAASEMAVFLEAMDLLGEKLGPILIQLPPNFSRAEEEAFTRFVAQLPGERQWAVEFRHRSWARGETAELLAEHDLCWTAADYIHMPKTLQRTTDFLYLRFLGRHGQFAAKDREQVDKTPVLQEWRDQIRPHLDEVTAVYAFFNNDYAGFSPATCNKFKRIMGLAAEEIRPLQQGRLF